MNNFERWMLPDGVEEILPDEAHQIEILRRQILDLFSLWGYDLVFPPMLEFTESLLIGLGQDLDLNTFKVVDQLSGRSMGIHADMTPQAARMDAHSLKREGVSRLCYSGHVLYTRPKSALATRTPFQVGVELFGEAGIEADIEIISLLLQTLKKAELADLCIDLGHVAIYRTLTKAAGLNQEQENTLFNLLQAKAITDIRDWIEANVVDSKAKRWFSELPKLSGASNVIGSARTIFADAPANVAKALDELEHIADVIGERYPEAQLYFDLSELRGYHYHTGAVFAAFAAGIGNEIASGGRYDHVGEVFGRSNRPATGFTADLVALKRLGQPRCDMRNGIFAPLSQHLKFWSTVQNLREQGERLIVGFDGQKLPKEFQNCDRKLIERDDAFVVEPLT